MMSLFIGHRSVTTVAILAEIKVTFYKIALHMRLVL